MRKESPILLLNGTRFALTEDGKFASTWVEYKGVQRRWDRDPDTGRLLGRRVTMLVYVNEHGYQDEVRADTPVWVIEDPSEEYDPAKHGK